jgi:hypothetical protein
MSAECCVMIGEALNYESAGGMMRSSLYGVTAARMSTTSLRAPHSESSTQHTRSALLQLRHVGHETFA